jgi:protoporphyrinogen IX oxidase
MYLYLKSIHIIFVVSWMAGLFYMVRLFVYHAEAREREEPARSILFRQFEVMESKLWFIISTPSMILTVLSGLWMMIAYKWYEQPWMLVKLGFVAGLLVYHFICQRIMFQFRSGNFRWKSMQLRIWNEVATILLFAIVFTVVLKSAVNWVYGLLGLVAFSILIMTAVKMYKRYRLKKK